LKKRKKNRGALGGRSKSLDSECFHGLVLGYTRTRGLMNAMQIVILLTYSVLCLSLNFLMRLLFKVLVAEPYAKIMLPSPS
jgi:hypothetical protein